MTEQTHDHSCEEDHQRGYAAGFEAGVNTREQGEPASATLDSAADMQAVADEAGPGEVLIPSLPEEYGCACEYVKGENPLCPLHGDKVVLRPVRPRVPWLRDDPVMDLLNRTARGLHSASHRGDFDICGVLICHDVRAALKENT